VLRQAHAATARAVIAVTPNDLVNLEVALLVRDLNPAQRVVVRLSDPTLAQTLREAANIRLALSVPVLVAPAFVAALFGDRVQNLFLVGGRLLSVVDLVVQPEDAGLVGQTVRAVAVDYRLLPVTLLPATSQPPEQPLHARLSPGDRLIGFVALQDVERLLRRDPIPHDCVVEVTRFPPPARATVSQHLRFQQGLSAADAEKALEQLPVCVAKDLTRGQAEDLLTFLQRDRVTVSLRQGDRVVR
jgi:Trk K+ transport system NAD-binding subunit